MNNSDDSGRFDLVKGVGSAVAILVVFVLVVFVLIGIVNLINGLAH